MGRLDVHQTDVDVQRKGADSGVFQPAPEGLAAQEIPGLDVLELPD